MNVSVWRSTQTHLLAPQRKISIILNLTVHSSSSEWLLIIHGEIEVRMLLLKESWVKKKKTIKTRRRRKIGYKLWEAVEKSWAFGCCVCACVCVSVCCGGKMNCTLGQKRKNLKRLFLKLNTKSLQLLLLTRSSQTFLMFSYQWCNARHL